MYKSAYYLVLVVLLGLAPVARAGDAAKAIINAGIDASFSEAERQAIQKYFGDRVMYTEQEQTRTNTSGHGRGKKGRGGGGTPPGLAKRKQLPPGLAKLQKNGSLPPGLSRKSLPSSLARQLPPPPDGYERQIVGDAAIVLINKATGKIADIVKGTLTGD